MGRGAQSITLKFSASHLHQTNPAFQVDRQTLHGKVKLIQGPLDVGDGQAEVAEVSGQDALPAQEVSGEGQEQVFARLGKNKNPKDTSVRD